MDFKDFKISKQLLNGLIDLGFESATPIQKATFSIIQSGRDIVGIAQTGTGKTLAYSLPLLQNLSFSNQLNPRIAILVPTRELVVQVVENLESYSQYKTVRIVGVYGGANINTQAQKVLQGCDIIVGTPGRFYDLAVNNALSLKSVTKLVIDEVDVMLDLGFRPQLNNIFQLIPERRQNIMFSATMTEEVDALLDDYFKNPERVSIAVSGTPLQNIEQLAYPVKNFYTKANLLIDLLQDKQTYHKVLIFVSSKRNADRLYDKMYEEMGDQMSVVHANKSQNFRLRSLEEFEEGVHRILISTDVMARGLDLEKISHVINVDVPMYPENYMHRIGRTGRAHEKGNSLLLFTEKEQQRKEAIEELMQMQIPTKEFPADVEVSTELIPKEMPKTDGGATLRVKLDFDGGGAFHEKKEKNKKRNVTREERKANRERKYKKPKTRGDKKANQRLKKKK